VADWLFDHQLVIQWGPLLAMLGALLLWESWLPRRAFSVPLGGRWFNQIALTALGSLAVRWAAPVAAVSFAALAQAEGWGLLNLVAAPNWVAILIGMLAIDLGMYLQHRLFHSVPLLWRFHQIHHCDLDVDCGTALRHHPGETLIAQAFDLAVIVAVGVPPLAVLAGFTLSGVASLFNHANIDVPPVVDRVLRWLVVTPDMHRVHHSSEIGESNRNFANLYSWWDRLFSTYAQAPQLGQRGLVVGLADIRSERDLSLWKLLALPFRRRRAAAYGELHLGETEAFQLERSP